MQVKRFLISVFFLFICLSGFFLPESEALFAWNILDLSASNDDKDEEAAGKCKACHQKVFDEIASLPFKHSNIVYKECEKCHLASRGRRNVSNPYLNRDEWRRVQFLNYSDEHLVVLEKLEKNKKYNLKVSFKDKAGKHGYIEDLTFTPSKIVEYWTNDKMPPVIVKAGVRKIDVSVLTSAEISIEVDELSSVKIEYGSSNKYGFFQFDKVFRKFHNLRLNGLALKKNYHYRVVATDSFGNSTTSKDYMFITSGPFQREENNAIELEYKEDIVTTLKILKYAESDPVNSKAGGKIQRISNFGRNKSRVAILFNADRDVTFVLKYIELKEESGNKGTAVRKKHGEWGLRSKKEAGIDACKVCHFQGASHPVGMAAKGDTIIPESMPTGERGVMICATCHSPHGSQFRYLSRIDFGENACAICHKGDVF